MRTTLIKSDLISPLTILSDEDFADKKKKKKSVYCMATVSRASFFVIVHDGRIMIGVERSAFAYLS